MIDYFTDIIEFFFFISRLQDYEFYFTKDSIINPSSIKCISFDSNKKINRVFIIHDSFRIR